MVRCGSHPKIGSPIYFHPLFVTMATNTLISYATHASNTVSIDKDEDAILVSFQV